MTIEPGEVVVGRGAREDFNRTKVGKHERETVITFTDGGAEAFVFTYNRGWLSHMKRIGAEVVFENGSGGTEFKVPSTWIRRPLPSRRKS